MIKCFPCGASWREWHTTWLLRCRPTTIFGALSLTSITILMYYVLLHWWNYRNTVKKSDCWRHFYFEDSKKKEKTKTESAYRPPAISDQLLWNKMQSSSNLNNNTILDLLPIIWATKCNKTSAAHQSAHTCITALCVQYQSHHTTHHIEYAGAELMSLICWLVMSPAILMALSFTVFAERGMSFIFWIISVLFLKSENRCSDILMNESFM